MKLFANGLAGLNVGDHELKTTDGMIDVPAEHLAEALSHGCTIEPLTPAASAPQGLDPDQVREIVGKLVGDALAGFQIPKAQLDGVAKSVSAELQKTAAGDLAKLAQELGKRLEGAETSVAGLAKSVEAFEKKLAELETRLAAVEKPKA